MKNIGVVTGILVFLFLLSACQTTPTSYKDSDAYKLEIASMNSLKELIRTNEDARELKKKAKAVLVFPNIIKAGFMYGGQLGDGTLFNATTDRKMGFYNTFAVSYGFQAGVQGFGYALFFMDNDSLSYIDKSAGLELGVGPSLVVLNKGMGKVLSSTTLKKGIYAFVFDQRGLMAGAGIQGTKITRIHP